MSVLAMFMNGYLKPLNSDLSFVDSESDSEPLRTELKFVQRLFAQFSYQISSILYSHYNQLDGRACFPEADRLSF
jgi:hypothetical protein